MRRDPALAPALVLATLAVACQAAIAAPGTSARSLEVRCHDSAGAAAEAAGVADIYVDVDGQAACLHGRLQLALEVALERIDPVARERRLLCSPTCWLDRPTSAIARVGHREHIWPAPPDIDLWIDDGWVVFLVAVPDLTERWLWIAVGPPGPGGRAEIEVIDG